MLGNDFNWLDDVENNGPTLYVTKTGYPIPKSEVQKMAKQEYADLQPGTFLYWCRVGSIANRESLPGATCEVLELKEDLIKVLIVETGEEYWFHRDAAFLFGLRTKVPDGFAAMATKRVLFPKQTVWNVSSGVIDMKKIGIVLDEWKLPIFERLLTEAGYQYETFSGPTKDCVTLTLTVEDTQVPRVHDLLKRAQLEARRSKMM